MELVDDLARRGVPAERVAAEVRFVHRSSLLTHLRSDDVPQQVTADAVREAERMLVAEYYQRVFGVDLPESVVGKGS